MHLIVLALLLAACRPTSRASDAASSPPEPAPTLPPHPPTAALGLSPKGDQALEMIIAAPAFGGSAVGAAGTPTPVVAAFRTLLAEPKATAAFEFAIDHGTLAGKLTALTGLWLVDRARFDVRVAPFKGSRDNVKLLQNGCAPGGDPTPVALIIERADAVRLAPRESLADWSTKHPGKAIEFDIIGGGYSWMFKGNTL